jgi:hypothetical protein
LKNEQDVHLFERLAFMARRDTAEAAYGATRGALKILWTTCRE